jgi:hypothetical protein
MKVDMHRMFIRQFLFVLLLLPTAYGANAEDLKVHISADMEGVAGAVDRAQMGPSGFEYGQFRKFMTAEVNAAITAAREEGATEIFVGDSHGNGLNLLLDELPQDIILARAWPRRLGMMEGIDESFDAAIFIGYHESEGPVLLLQSGAPRTEEIQRQYCQYRFGCRFDGLSRDHSLLRDEGWRREHVARNGAGNCTRCAG